MEETEIGETEIRRDRLGYVPIGPVAVNSRAQLRHQRKDEVAKYSAPAIANGIRSYGEKAFTVLTPCKKAVSNWDGHTSLIVLDVHHWACSIGTVAPKKVSTGG